MMKNRIVLYLFILIMMISFCACSAKEGTELSETQATESVQTVAPEPTSSQTPAPTATPMLTPTPVSPLSFGEKSEEVRELQMRLAELGYLKADATSYFGEKTQKAVTEFQRENKLSETGIADEQTQKAVYSEEAVPCPLPLAGYVIGIDPGHQAKGNAEQEPVAPNSNKTKKKVSSGTQGRFSRVPEYEVNLAVGLLLRDLLEEQGATVVMTRETNDVNISNVERAQLFNEKKTDYALRLHCNGSEDKTIHGAFMLVPTENPYLEECDRAAELLIEEYCKATGAKNLGITKRSDQTGFNWSERMVINIEMGHMTNKEEDFKLTDAKYQEKMAQGLADGILAYFKAI